MPADVSTPKPREKGHDVSKGILSTLRWSGERGRLDACAMWGGLRCACFLHASCLLLRCHAGAPYPACPVALWPLPRRLLASRAYTHGGRGVALPPFCVLAMVESRGTSVCIVYAHGVGRRFGRPDRFPPFFFTHDVSFLLLRTHHTNARQQPFHVLGGASSLAPSLVGGEA